ncbi:MAG: hypothetical protein AAFS01_12850 [Pseudomonadota bacterium]
MRILLFVLFAAFAVPAVAQQERECRGKQPIDLGDGAAGCLLEIGTTSITSTRTRDDGASSKSTRNVTGRIDVALFGAYSDNRTVISGRMKAICRSLLPQVQQELAELRYNRIVINLVWPRVENPGTFIPKSELEFAVQPAFTSAQCRGVRFFG